MRPEEQPGSNAKFGIAAQRWCRCEAATSGAAFHVCRCVSLKVNLQSGYIDFTTNEASVPKRQFNPVTDTRMSDTNGSKWRGNADGGQT